MSPVLGNRVLVSEGSSMKDEGKSCIGMGIESQ